MSVEEMQEELTNDIFSQCKDLPLRYCDCVAIANKLINLGWEKKLNGESQKEILENVRFKPLQV